jgi:hypothetical protein
MRGKIRKNQIFFRSFYRAKIRELFFSVKNKIKNNFYCTMCEFLWFWRGLCEKWPFFVERSLLGLFNPLQIRVFFMSSWEDVQLDENLARIWTLFLCFLAEFEGSLDFGKNRVILSLSKLLCHFFEKFFYNLRNFFIIWEIILMF